MKDKEKRVFNKNFIVMSLLLSSVLALSLLFMNIGEQKSVLANEKHANNERLKVYAGGDNIGVKISIEGILVVSFSDIESVDGKIIKSPAQSSGINIGDTILSVDGKSINTSKELVEIVNGSETGTVAVKVNRDGSETTKNVNLLKNNLGNYKLGMWVRDSTAGIGTLTFVDGNTGVYGGLGHPITDSETERVLSVLKGDLIRSTVINVRKGEVGSPGELKGIFTNEKMPIGTVGKNTETGIFGVVDAKNMNRFNESSKLYEIGFKNEVQEGNAQIITTTDEQGPKFYDISIEKVIGTAKGPNKNMLIKVTDEELLAKTGGIVQGMSGSPIIQNGRIIGAVTHVLVNKPNVGYGIYIENMLNDANLIK